MAFHLFGAKPLFEFTLVCMCVSEPFEKMLTKFETKYNNMYRKWIYKCLQISGHFISTSISSDTRITACFNGQIKRRAFYSGDIVVGEGW